MCCLCLDSLQCIEVLALTKKLGRNVKRSKTMEQMLRSKQICDKMSARDLFGKDDELIRSLINVMFVRYLSA